MKSRWGFTLVEMLLVVILIGVLVGLLLPALGGAIRTARSASVTSDINSLATALTQFKGTYGDYPPSRILLNETGTYNVTSTTPVASWFSDTRTDITIGQLSQRTVSAMSRFFPRASCFSTVGGNPVDYNGDGKTTSVFYLSGDECLVFFLGGMTNLPMQQVAVSDIGMIGFSRNPLNPFDRTSTSRTQPLYEFKGNRLVDFDQDGWPSLIDTLGGNQQGRYYAYFSAYHGNGYDPNDCNSVQYDPFGSGGVAVSDPIATSLNDVFARSFVVMFQVVSNSETSVYSPQTNICVSPSPNPYCQSGYPGGVPDFNLKPNVTRQPVFQNPNTFQIVSAGVDQIYGVAGQYTNTGTQHIPVPLVETKAPFSPAWTGGVVGGAVIDGERSVENDNLSNFTNTRLNY